MKKVSFTEMKNGTKEDYLFLDKHEKDFASINNRKKRKINSSYNPAPIDKIKLFKNKLSL